MFDDNWTDTLLCHSSLSVLKFMKKAYYTHDKWIDLKVAGGDDMNGKIRLKVTFEPAKVGLLRILLNSATNLADGGALNFDKNDPYVQASLGKNKCRSRTCDNAGANANWCGEEVSERSKRVLIKRERLEER